jgi:hypothetical protein
VAKSKGNVIVLLYTMFVNFLRWSIGFYLMKPDKKEINHNEGVNLSIERKEYNLVENNSEERNETIQKKLSTVTAKDVKFGDNNNDNNSDSDEFSCIQFLKEVLNIPFLAGVLAILLSSLPGVNKYCSDPNSLFYKLIVGKYII